MHSSARMIGANDRPRWMKVRAAIAFGIGTLFVLFVLLSMCARVSLAQNEAVLYYFTLDGSAGSNPESPLTFDSAGNLYGTTPNGGLGYGTVFELSPAGGGAWNETTLHSFTGGTDGANPGLSYLIFDSAGNLYGTADGGGAYGNGVVFELSPVGGSWTETVLYSFANNGDGAGPQGTLIFDPAGNLYGTNLLGVFELSPSGGNWTETMILERGSFGIGAGLIMDADGNIFDTGMLLDNYALLVFELSPNGNGGWNPTVIYTFPAPGKDGQCPQGCGITGTLALDKSGNLYGTTYVGGAYKLGTLYELTPGNGSWAQNILHSFTGAPGDGMNPLGGVALDAAGNIYGVTQWGGSDKMGSIFKFSNSTESTVFSFYGTSGGEEPLAGVILDKVGNLYGTTYCCGGGFVYEVNQSPKATQTALTSSPNPSVYQRAVTFTAVVTPTPPDGETVSFMQKIGKKVYLLGTGVLSSGSASFTTSALKLGTAKITAAYAGDFNFLGSTSNTVMQVVENPVRTTTTLASSPNPSGYGEAVTLAAEVTSGDGAPPDGETVTFETGPTVLGTGTLSGGSASFTTSTLKAGTTSVKATYGGNYYFLGSKSNVVKQLVEKTEE